MDENDSAVRDAEVNVALILQTGPIKDLTATAAPGGWAKFSVTASQAGLDELCITDVVLTAWTHDPGQHELVATGSGDCVRASNLEQVRAVVGHNTGKFNKRAPYLCMLREWVRKAKEAGEFDSLLQFNIDPEALIQG